MDMKVLGALLIAVAVIVLGLLFWDELPVRVTGVAAWPTGARVVLVCGAYFGVVYVTARTFIASPQCRELLAELDGFLFQSDALLSDPAAVRTPGLGQDTRERIREVAAAIKDDLVVPLRARTTLRPTLSVAKVIAGWRKLHSAQWTLYWALRDSALASHIEPLALGLERHGVRDLSTRLRSAQRANVRPLIMQAVSVVNERDDEQRQLNAQEQRRSLWLALIGLFGIVALGVATQRTYILLFGGLGGFLAPIAGLLLRRPGKGDYRRSWGVLMLSPVAGALTALAGMLLIQMLSHPSISVLGDVFREHSWNNPRTGITLALSVLFGFSGKLFSDIALKASSQLAEPPNPEDETPAGGDGGESPPPSTVVSDS
jgi:hypothetical protein